MTDTRRLNITLPTKTFERLERLKERTEAMSMTEVIRLALIRYEESLEKKP